MRLVIVDDHEVVREGLRAALATNPGIEIVGEAPTGGEALRVLRRTLPDLVLLDFRLPDVSGPDLCETIRRHFPATAVVILTTYLSEETVRRGMEAGAAGYVTKAAGLSELRKVLSRVARGEPDPTSYSGEIVKRLHGAAAAHGEGGIRLTPQQERVVELVVDGLTYGQIASRLFISESTVRFHIQGLKARFKVATRAELIATAIRLALVEPGPDGPSSVSGS